VLILKIKNILN